MWAVEGGGGEGGRRSEKDQSVCGECCGFFFNDTATTEIYTLSLHDALPICSSWLHDLNGAFVTEIIGLLCQVVV